jgi:hypothetical protein|nr:MAG TPA: hypothetical protein [Caudoviricetes sp.]
MEDVVKMVTTDNEVEDSTVVKTEEDVLMQTLIREFPAAVAEVVETIAGIKKDAGMVDVDKMAVTYLQSKLEGLRVQRGRVSMKQAESPLMLMRNLAYMDKLSASELEFEMVQSYLMDYYRILGKELTLVEPPLWITEADFAAYMELRAKCSPSHLKNASFALSLQYLLSRPRALAQGTTFKGFVETGAGIVDFEQEEKLIRYIKYNADQKRKRDGVVMLHDLYFKEYKAKLAERKAFLANIDAEIEYLRDRYREQKMIDLGE